MKSKINKESPDISLPPKAETGEIVLSLLVAASENNVIGKDNQLPWHLPSDLKYFKNQTWGMPILMGRKTFESIGKPLQGRRSIVITRNKNWQHENVDVVHSIDEAIEKAKAYSHWSGMGYIEDVIGFLSDWWEKQDQLDAAAAISDRSVLPSENEELHPRAPIWWAWENFMRQRELQLILV